MHMFGARMTRHEDDMCDAHNQPLSPAVSVDTESFRSGHISVNTC